jgi:hypothetical protein
MTKNIVTVSLTTSQSSKEATIETEVTQLDNAFSETHDVDLTIADVSLNATTFKGALRFNMKNVSTARAVTISAPSKKFSLFVADAANTADVTLTVGTSTVVFAPGQSRIIYLDGTANGLENANSGGLALAGLTDDVTISTPTNAQGLEYDSADTVWKNKNILYRIGFQVEGLTDNAEVIGRFVAPDAFRVLSGGGASIAKAGTAATASTTYTLKKNGASFATAVFAISGTTATWTAASDTDFAAGDVLTVEGSATADATLAGLGMTLCGVRI